MKYQLVGRFAALMGAVVLAPTLIQAQPAGGGFRGGPGAPGGFGGGTLGLVLRDDVQQELQLVNEQREKLRQMAEESRQRLREELRDSFSRTRDLSDQQRRDRFQEIRGRLEALNAKFDGQLREVLLPHQFERLKQIELQMRVQQRGASALTSGELADALGLSNEQREQLQQRAEEVQQELQEKIRQLRAEARDKMLDVLTPQQRAKLDQLMGDSFEAQDENRRFGGRGGFRGEGRRTRDGAAPGNDRSN